MITSRPSRLPARGALPRFTTVITVLATLIVAAVAEPLPSARPQLFTNESYVSEVSRAAAFDIADPMAVFEYVLSSLPERVRVFPTENYYYFRFTHTGVPFAGNIRFDPRDRDEGKIHFVYYEDHAEWKKDGFEKFDALDSSRDVTVERLEPLVYRVSYKAKSVTFALNDVSKIKPPPSIIHADEQVIGPVFDESAIRFFLVFNTRLKIFLYILDETESVPDVLVRAERTDRILIGKRTGFAFYRDARLDRKILIGVFSTNAELNNYFDGPFDQLPENFIEGDVLRQAIVDSDPDVDARIGRLGHMPGDEGRYAIAPYMQYQRESDLLIFHSCATNGRVAAANYYRCFVIDTEDLRGVGRPLALRGIRSKSGK
jgi:hypothetical protein